VHKFLGSNSNLIEDFWAAQGNHGMFFVCRVVLVVLVAVLLVFVYYCLFISDELNLCNA
jgi:uncharacterized membrane protein